MKQKSKARILSIVLKPRSFDEINKILEENASKDCDLILLPETCLGNESTLSMDSEELKKVSAIAKKHGKYIIFPCYRKTAQAERLNSAILFDRTGKETGIYDKVYPYWEEFDLSPPVTPGNDVPVFETDFGTIGIAICFDVNFPGIWKQFRQKGARLILWASAYSGGRSLQAHAINYNYYIVTSTQYPDCHAFDITGQEIFYEKSDDVGVYLNEVDLDRSIFHQDFNMYEKHDKILKEQTGKIERDNWHDKEGWFTLRAIKDGVSVRALAKEYEMEELPQYKMRSEAEIDNMKE